MLRQVAKEGSRVACRRAASIQTYSLCRTFCSEVSEASAPSEASEQEIQKTLPSFSSDEVIDNRMHIFVEDDAGLPAPSEDDMNVPAAFKSNDSLPEWVKGFDLAFQLHKQWEEEEAAKNRKIIPAIVRETTIDVHGRCNGTGRRKSAIAEVWIKRKDDEFPAVPEAPELEPTKAPESNIGVADIIFHVKEVEKSNMARRLADSANVGAFGRSPLDSVVGDDGTSTLKLAFEPSSIVKELSGQTAQEEEGQENGVEEQGGHDDENEADLEESEMDRELSEFDGELSDFDREESEPVFKDTKVQVKSAGAKIPENQADWEFLDSNVADYFNERKYLLEKINEPFVVTNTEDRFDVFCRVYGGGHSGQAGAIRLGIARALQNFNPTYRANLKRAGLLTRDPRVVERKKPGQKKARKKFQWVKR